MKRLFFILISMLTVYSAYGQAWEDVGTGLNDNVYDLVKMDSNIYAGGRVGTAFWNGSTWTALPHVFGMAWPLSLAVYNDTLYAGGDFPFSPMTYNRVSKFDGTNWLPVGDDIEDPSWSSTKRLLSINGQLIAAGHFSSIDVVTTTNIAAWNGSSWTNLGSGLNDLVLHLAEHNGDLYASGDFTASGADNTVKHIGRWNGSVWSAIDTSHTFTHAGPMISFDSLLIIGEVWDTINGIPMKGIAGWDGNSFIPMGSGLIHRVDNFWIFNNELYACADLYMLNPFDYLNVVIKWNGIIWEQVGIDFESRIWTVYDYNNELFCAGMYDSPTDFVAKYSATIGLNEPNEQMQIQVYPNPATDYFIISNPGQGQLTITNSLGQIVYSSLTADKLTRVQTDKFESGIYFVTFQSDNKEATCKIIIQ
jgi:hypothetical protein